MMNFLTKAISPDLEFDKNSTFDEFLEKFKLTEKLKKFICSSIVFSTPDAIKCTEGIELLQKFLKSLGRYSACSSFLVPLYGSGELSQAFSRMSAVFGGITILDHPPSSIVFKNEKIDCITIKYRSSEENLETEKVKEIKADHFISEPVYLKDNMEFEAKSHIFQKIMVIPEEDWKAKIKDSEKVIGG
jgi:RAB protein geranylgeranyltransferase component A